MQFDLVYVIERQIDNRGPFHWFGLILIPTLISNLSHVQLNVGWKCLSIPKLQRSNCWSLGMNKYRHNTFYNRWNYLSILGLKLIVVSSCCFCFLMPPNAHALQFYSWLLSNSRTHIPWLWRLWWNQIQEQLLAWNHLNYKNTLNAIWTISVQFLMPRFTMNGRS